LLASSRIPGNLIDVPVGRIPASNCSDGLPLVQAVVSPQEAVMARDPDARQQDRAMRNIAVWGGVLGVILVAMLIIWALQPGHGSGTR
jgi:hypothetical protein